MPFAFDFPLLSAIPFPEIDPVFFSLGPLKFRWYGLMYLLGLTGAYFLIRARARAKNISLSQEQLSDLIVYAALGVFLGGRLGYTLFYNAGYYLDHMLTLGSRRPSRTVTEKIQHIVQQHKINRISPGPHHHRLQERAIVLPPKGFKPFLVEIIIPSHHILFGSQGIDDIRGQCFEVIDHEITLLDFS